MLNSFIKRLVDKDTQTLIKAGYMDKDLSLTQCGVNEIMALFLVANKEALVKAAQEKLEEEKK